jgi:dTDP-4-amino-4,6-dideoxygalactose transaminase
MKKILNYSTQTINQNDLNNVLKVLKSKFLTKGKVTEDFEKKIKSYCKSKYVCATINASSSLIIACKALGLQKGDFVWTSNITYIASINCALHLGAKIDLVDIDDSNNISVIDLEKKLKVAKLNKKLPKIIVAVHLSGLPCNLKRIRQLSKIYHFKIIEDASHAFGSKYKKSMIGSNRYSDLSVFSFHPVKNITTAEGSAITTNNIDIHKKLLLLRENGQDFNKINKLKFPTKYNITLLGYNFRINEINSSLGISQIKKTNKFINQKKIIAKKYFKELILPEINLPNKDILSQSALHLFIIKINFKMLNINKYELINKLKKKKIIVNCHYIPLSKFKILKKFISNKNFDNSEKY